jgi:hypothetical protein
MSNIDLSGTKLRFAETMSLSDDSDQSCILIGCSANCRNQTCAVARCATLCKTVCSTPLLC